MAINCTVTINSSEARVLTGEQIRKTELNFKLPFHLQLSDQSIFISERVVRHIPGRRMVVFGLWNNKPVVAKLFFDRFRAAQQLKKDVQGVTTLNEHRIPTPAVLFEGTNTENDIHVLIFERILQSQNLEEVWQAKEHPDDVWQAFSAVTVELATQHVFGIVQRDLHLKNFLVTDKTIYTLDGAQVTLHDPILPKRQSVESLALFLAQLGVGNEELQIQLYELYARSRGWVIKPQDIAELQIEIRKINEARWQRYANKIFRNCTAYKRFKTWSMTGMYDRDYDSADFQAFLQSPDTVFQHPAAQMLKDGRSSTVIRVTLDNRDIVIKRYNMKNMKHRLRRFFRQTRAAKCWRLANKLCLFGVATAKPIAYLENNFLGMRGKSYYVTEYVSGDNLLAVVTRMVKNGDVTAPMMTRITMVLNHLMQLDITHGDLKASNILIDQQQRPVLIDLDGAAEHFSLSGLRRAWKKDVERFIANFE